MTATARKASLENKQLRNLNYFAIIASCSHFAMLVEECYNWTCVQAGKLNTEKIYGYMLKLSSKP